MFTAMVCFVAVDSSQGNASLNGQPGQSYPRPRRQEQGTASDTYWLLQRDPNEVTIANHAGWKEKSCQMPDRESVEGKLV